ncbi:hypothetical protein [Parasitella parasitica]|uniref:Uncharacterized protein n=1 Tax=Parasitella parasitica TaxID=35722 RepID=A0A0B7NUX7_9FUNG|nr:hypothetical protein [Parasitella parasitica]
MENPKALQTLIDLEVARCNERWSDIPELAKRYKKYHPFESVLEFTARMEAEFVLLVRQIRQEIVVKGSNVSDLPSPPSSPPAAPAATSTARKWGNRQTTSTAIGSKSYFGNSSVSGGATSAVKSSYPEESDIFYQLDDPSSISLAPRLLPFQAQLILVKLLDVIQKQIKLGELETPDDWQAQFSKIIVARIYYETGRYEKALEWLQHLALRLEDVETGYGLVLLVQARVIKGVCFEIQDNSSDALECYLGALKVVEQHPQEQNKSLSFWIEECLYRSVLLQLRRKSPVKQTLKLMRAYLHYCSTQWTSEWRMHKRWIVFRHYIRYLTRAYQKGVYVPALPDDEYTSPGSPVLSVLPEPGKKTTLFESSTAALEETAQLTTQFLRLFTVFADKYHKANPTDLNHRALELTNLLFTAHDTVGWGSIDYIGRILRYLHKSRQYTFNSLCTTRHLFYTLLKLGQVHEARLALFEYLGLLNAPDVLGSASQRISYSSGGEGDEEEDAFREKTIAETIQHRLAYITSQSASSLNRNLLYWEDKLRSLQGTQEHKDNALYSSDDNDDQTPEPKRRMPQKKPPVGSYESDMEFDTVRVIIAAAQQLFGQHYRQGQEASALSDIAVALMEESEHLRKKKAGQWRSLMVQSRRVQGSSYGLYATQCCDEKKRSMCLVESIASLTRASELDSRSWQTFYELGLEQAIVGDMASAAASAKRSIKLRSDFIPSWHLLALIQSCRQFHALPKSLQLIQAALDHHSDMAVENFDHESLLTLDTQEGQEFFSRAEAYMKLRMTQVCLLERLEGAEAALAVYPDLFDMYAKLSRRMGLDASSGLDVAHNKPTQSCRKLSVVSSSQRHDGGNSSARSRANSRTSVRHGSLSSLSSSSFALPPQQQLDNDDNLDLDNGLGKESDSALYKVDKKEAPAEKSHRKSINVFMDDPLLSFPAGRSHRKDKSKALGAKLLFRSSSSAVVDSLSADEAKHSQYVQADATPIDTDNVSYSAPFSGHASSGSLSAKGGSLKQQDQDSLATARDAYCHRRREQWQCILNKIWIMASAAYARAQRYEEALRAIAEADALTHGLDADVWNQIGTIAALINTKKGAPQHEQSVDAFKRALSIDPDHAVSHISLAARYIEMGKFELAEQLLEKTTKGLGWSQTEAWYLLSKVYTHQECLLDAKNSLIYALKLSDTRPIESLDVLPRFV